MKALTLPSMLGVLLALCLHAAPAEAQWPLTFVSHSGSNANNCGTELTPCRTFQGAHDKTQNGGLITCVDSGYFGGGVGLAIVKSIIIPPKLDPPRLAVAEIIMRAD